MTNTLKSIYFYISTQCEFVIYKIIRINKFSIEYITTNIPYLELPLNTVCFSNCISLLSLSLYNNSIDLFV